MDDVERDLELARSVRALEAFAARVRPAEAGATAVLDAAAVEVLEALARDAVDGLLLKGPALDRMLYAASEHRRYSDVDILVPPGRVDDARRTLRHLGYRNASETHGVDDIGHVVHAETWIGRPSAGSDDVVVELHLWLAGANAPTEVAWEALSTRRTQLELPEGSVPVLDRNGQALHLALHAAQHGPQYAKGCRELEMAFERWPGDVWEQAAKLADETQATTAFAAGLRLVPAGASLAERLGLPATAQLDWEIRQASRPRGTFHLAALGEAHGLWGRASVLRRALVPRPRWIRHQYSWVGEGRLRLAAAYGAHLLRSPAWAARAWWYHRRARRAAAGTRE